MSPGAVRDLTTAAAANVLADEALGALRARIRGAVLGPGEPGYDAARRVFNAMVDRRPALIARCAGAADVSAAVTFAREHRLPLSVRGGGHGVTGAAICDGGLTIDLSGMRGVRVDPRHHTARAGGGATWGDVDHETQAFGLATTGGIVPSTGVAGLTLGGGIGYLNRKHGLACDNLVSADVVTADGRVLTAGAGEHEDLFWALRGGGANFGAVTSLEYRLHPVGAVLAGELVHPLDRAREALRFYRDWSTGAPDEVRADATLLSGPEGPALAMLVCYAGDIARGEAVLRPLRAFGPPIVDTIAPVPYRTVQNLLTEILTPGFHHYWKSGFVRELPDDAIERLVDFFAANVPAPFAAVAIEHLGGAIGRVPEGETAFAHRRAQHSVLVLRAWRDPAESARSVAWGRACYAVVEPFLDEGVYVNYLGDEGDTRTRAAYGASYQRLAALKHRYDPDNLFRHNQNVVPQAR